MPCSIGYDVSNTTIQCTLVAGPKLREYNKSYPSWKIVGPITKISKGNFCKGRELNFVYIIKFFIETTVIPEILGGSYFIIYLISNVVCCHRLANVCVDK